MTQTMAYVVLLVGGVLALSTLIRPGLEKLRIPALVGYLVLGLILRLAETQVHFLSQHVREIFEYMAQMGLVALLFRVGLESDLVGLLAQLRRASIVWAANLVVSGLAGFAVALALGLSWMTGLILAVAFTATSVGVTVGIWQEADALRCPSGRLLVDVAELDDISAVLLMALLFSVLPDLRSGGSGAGADVAATLAWFALKILIYGAFCYVFSKFVEGPLTRWYRNLEKPPEPMILVIGLGTLIAAVAGLLGFSLAIGAFFAGLIFSRDPESVKMEGSFLPLYEFFAPFFFIGIGLSLDPAHLAPAFGLGLVLTVAAAASKFVGNAAPVYYMTGVSGAVLIGSSMIPRAEITMVIMQKGLEMGPWAVPPHVYGAMVVVSAATCLGAPFLVKHLLATCLPKMENESWTSNHCD